MYYCIWDVLVYPTNPEVQVVQSLSNLFPLMQVLPHAVKGRHQVLVKLYHPGEERSRLYWWIFLHIFHDCHHPTLKALAT